MSFFRKIAGQVRVMDSSSDRNSLSHTIGGIGHGIMESFIPLPKEQEVRQSFHPEFLERALKGGEARGMIVEPLVLKASNYIEPWSQWSIGGGKLLDERMERAFVLERPFSSAGKLIDIPKRAGQKDKAGQNTPTHPIQLPPTLQSGMQKEIERKDKINKAVLAVESQSKIVDVKTDIYADVLSGNTLVN